MDQAKELPRGTGYLARYLISCPESTMGTRLFREPEDTSLLDAFNERTKQLLELPLTMDEDGTLTPPEGHLSAEAKKEWIAFHDQIEVELRAAGELHDIPDVAAKAADNVARLAAVFQCDEMDPTPEGFEISADNVVRASAIVAWHLWESLRFFNELALPEDIRSAMKLEQWLVQRCKGQQRSSIPKNHVRQCGPGSLRDNKRFEDAMDVLIELNHVRLILRGKQTQIEVHPSLLGDEL
jgi:putative DNA primase/helicase